MSNQPSGNHYDPCLDQWNGTLIDKWEPSWWKQWRPKSSTKNDLVKLERKYLILKYAMAQTNLALSLDIEWIEN